MNITEQLLLNNGFVKSNSIMPMLRKIIKNKASIQMTYNSEPLNSGRFWVVHLDNDRFESIGYAEIDNTEQLQLLCQIYNIDYNLIINNQ